jgi:hypothetical protein
MLVLSLHLHAAQRIAAKLRPRVRLP